MLFHGCDGLLKITWTISKKVRESKLLISPIIYCHLKYFQEDVL